MPDTKDTTAYELALALKNDFPARIWVCGLNAPEYEPGNGAEFDITALMALAEPLPAEYHNAVRALAEQVGGHRISASLPGFIDAIIEVNISKAVGRAGSCIHNAGGALLPTVEGLRSMIFTRRSRH